MDEMPRELYAVLIPRFEGGPDNGYWMAREGIQDIMQALPADGRLREVFIFRPSGKRMVKIDPHMGPEMPLDPPVQA